MASSEDCGRRASACHPRPMDSGAASPIATTSAASGEPAHYSLDCCFTTIAPPDSRESSALCGDYYLHYPKLRSVTGRRPLCRRGRVDAGIRTSRASVMLFIAAMALALAWQSGGIAAVHGRRGLIAAATLLLMPLMQYVSSRVLTDTLEAALCFAALTCFARYLNTNAGKTPPPSSPWRVSHSHQRRGAAAGRGSAGIGSSAAALQPAARLSSGSGALSRSSVCRVHAVAEHRLREPPRGPGHSFRHRAIGTLPRNRADAVRPSPL